MFDRYNTVDLEDAKKAVSDFNAYLQNVSKSVSNEAKNEK
jgi:hypothetical protein